MKKINRETIKDAEFIGLFLGEGYCGIVKKKHKSKYKDKIYNYLLFQPQMSLAQRDDNSEMIYWIQKRYGGNIWVSRNVKSPNGKRCSGIFWTLVNQGKCLNLCNILLQGNIPSKKLNSVRIMKKYLEWKQKRGLQKPYSEKDFELLESWYLSIKKNHAYSQGH